MTEVDLERHVRRLCDGLGLLSYHTRDSRRSVRGFPDFVIAGSHVLFRELKREKGRVSEEQREWLHALSVAGADAGIWWPRDLMSGRIAEELAAISKLGRRAA